MLRPPKRRGFFLDFGDCSPKGRFPKLSQCVSEHQFPQFHSGSGAVTLVFCFGFLLLFRVSGAAEPEVGDQRIASVMY